MSKSEKKLAEIATEAYYLFLNRGMEPSQDADDWFKAEAIVEERYRTMKEDGKDSAPNKGDKLQPVQGKKK